MPAKTINGTFWTAITAIVTALIPLIMQLTSNTERKVDVGYELLKQKTEFQDKEMAALRDDIHEIQQYMMQLMKEMNRRRESTTAESDRSGGTGVVLKPPAELGLVKEVLLPSPPELSEAPPQQRALPPNLAAAL